MNLIIFIFSIMIGFLTIVTLKKPHKKNNYSKIPYIKIALGNYARINGNLPIASDKSGKSKSGKNQNIPYKTLGIPKYFAYHNHEIYYQPDSNLFKILKIIPPDHPYWFIGPSIKPKMQKPQISDWLDARFKKYTNICAINSAPIKLKFNQKDFLFSKEDIMNSINSSCKRLFFANQEDNLDNQDILRKLRVSQKVSSQTNKEAIKYDLKYESMAMEIGKKKSINFGIRKNPVYQTHFKNKVAQIIIY